jgi:hypothetical protein
MPYPVVEEHKVLMASTRYLAERGALPYRFSAVRGRSINTSEIIAYISKLFEPLDSYLVTLRVYLSHWQVADNSAF